MPFRKRVMAATWIGVLACAGMIGGTLQALADPEGAPASTMTVRPTSSVAQNGVSAGPLEGPLASPGAGGRAACCACRRVARHVVHRSVRVARRRSVASATVPLVPLVPYRLVYAYRPVVPVYAYRPYFYRPLLYRPFFYSRAFY